MAILLNCYLVIQTPLNDSEKVSRKEITNSIIIEKVILPQKFWPSRRISLLKKTRNRSIFGKWHTSKWTCRTQNLEQDEFSILTSKADAVHSNERFWSYN
ncbi:hypothetical protein GLOIN_2v1470631 [Rhizophagus irregularis DAOM 181602=DAOM 197198]|nr:hypothetical protein GLOIN_2v1470631 [Rhizophagus irregularis DAOM 181602=DAOM 197198]